MSAYDDYARKEAERNRKYLAAYRSEEAKAWRSSLDPAQYERAEQLGLLDPSLDRPSYSLSLEKLPAKLHPRQESATAALFSPNDAPGPDWDECLTGKKRLLLESFLNQEGNPRLRWACLCYLAGEGTCEDFAHPLGMSRQTFHYHVRKLSRQLGLPAMGNQRARRPSPAFNRNEASRKQRTYRRP